MPWKDKSRYRSEEYREYMRDYQRDWHQKNKVKRVAQVHERKDRLWAFYNQLKETLQCNKCGEKHPATLQFHHLDPQQKEFNLSEAVRRGFSVETIQKEIAKCAVLCANCHAKLYYEEARQNNARVKGGLAEQLLEIEEVFSVNQQEGI